MQFHNDVAEIHNSFVWDPAEERFYCTPRDFAILYRTATRLPVTYQSPGVTGHGLPATPEQVTEELVIPARQAANLYTIYWWGKEGPHDLQHADFIHVAGLGHFFPAPEQEDLVPIAHRCPVCLEQRADFLDVTPGPDDQARQVMCERCMTQFFIPPAQPPVAGEAVTLPGDEEDLVAAVSACPGCGEWRLSQMDWDEITETFACRICGRTYRPGPGRSEPVPAPEPVWQAPGLETVYVSREQFASLTYILWALDHLASTHQETKLGCNEVQVVSILTEDPSQHMLAAVRFAGTGLQICPKP